MKESGGALVAPICLRTADAQPPAISLCSCKGSAIRHTSGWWRWCPPAHHHPTAERRRSKRLATTHCSLRWKAASPPPRPWSQPTSRRNFGWRRFRCRCKSPATRHQVIIRAPRCGNSHTRRSRAMTRNRPPLLSRERPRLPGLFYLARTSQTAPLLAWSKYPTTTYLAQ